MADEPAFTVGSYGSIIEFRDGQWLRDGVPFDPDPPPISDDLTAMLVDPAKITGPGWGKTITIPGGGDDFLARAREYAAIRAEIQRCQMAIMATANSLIGRRRRPRSPWWARLAGAAITGGILVGAIKDGLRRER